MEAVALWSVPWKDVLFLVPFLSLIFIATTLE